jgi:hypothetical protein
MLLALAQNSFLLNLLIIFLLLPYMLYELPPALAGGRILLDFFGFSQSHFLYIKNYTSKGGFKSIGTLRSN